MISIPDSVNALSQKLSLDPYRESQEMEREGGNQNSRNTSTSEDYIISSRDLVHVEIRDKNAKADDNSRIQITTQVRLSKAHNVNSVKKHLALEYGIYPVIVYRMQGDQFEQLSNERTLDDLSKSWVGENHLKLYIEMTIERPFVKGSCIAYLKHAKLPNFDMQLTSKGVAEVENGEKILGLSSFGELESKVIIQNRQIELKDNRSHDIEHSTKNKESKLYLLLVEVVLKNGVSITCNNTLFFLCQGKEGKISFKRFTHQFDSQRQRLTQSDKVLYLDPQTYQMSFVQISRINIETIREKSSLYSKFQYFHLHSKADNSTGSAVFVSGICVNFSTDAKIQTPKLPLNVVIKSEQQQEIKEQSFQSESFSLSGKAVDNGSESTRAVSKEEVDGKAWFSGDTLLTIGQEIINRSVSQIEVTHELSQKQIKHQQWYQSYAKFDNDYLRVVSKQESQFDRHIEIYLSNGSVIKCNWGAQLLCYDQQKCEKQRKYQFKSYSANHESQMLCKGQLLYHNQKQPVSIRNVYEVHGSITLYHLNLTKIEQEEEQLEWSRQQGQQGQQEDLNKNLQGQEEVTLFVEGVCCLNKSRVTELQEDFPDLKQQVLDEYHKITFFYKGRSIGSIDFEKDYREGTLLSHFNFKNQKDRIFFVLIGGFCLEMGIRIEGLRIFVLLNQISENICVIQDSHSILKRFSNQIQIYDNSRQKEVPNFLKFLKDRKRPQRLEQTLSMASELQKNMPYEIKNYQKEIVHINTVYLKIPKVFCTKDFVPFQIHFWPKFMVVLMRKPNAKEVSEDQVLFQIQSHSLKICGDGPAFIFPFTYFYVWSVDSLENSANTLFVKLHELQRPLLTKNVILWADFRPENNNSEISYAKQELNVQVILCKSTVGALLWLRIFGEQFWQLAKSKSIRIISSMRRVQWDPSLKRQYFYHYAGPDLVKQLRCGRSSQWLQNKQSIHIPVQNTPIRIYCGNFNSAIEGFNTFEVEFNQENILTECKELESFLDFTQQVLL